MQDITPLDIEKLSYTDFVSLLHEENRPPGGKKTVREIILNSFVDRQANVLEVGCTNGFTSLEVARLIGCQVTGVDISSSSVQNSIDRLERSCTPGNVKFLVESVYDLPFDNNLFDLVVLSNAISFIEDQKTALDECIRVIKPWGFLAVVPIWYKVDPPEEIVDQVSTIIGVKIKIRKKADWINFLNQSGLEMYYSCDYHFDTQSPEIISQYVDEICKKEHLQKYPEYVVKDISDRWKMTIEVFNQNLRYAAYSVLLLRKRAETEESELFSTSPCKQYTCSKRVRVCHV
ncbi:class I SAM-dependent methyltransferase [Synechococcus sp. BA-124 BA4]|uniref:class I SAM-dependent methyltransferase n=1 Tax=unclassified Synechococcus TaxID=2626047 RepID=UPI002AD58CCC|nr:MULTISPECIES: class I SAM-dependent methyltransferase [unclassified Synechococcus]MEA5400743.1 class I SAM-dependent methyltransferase [Synechococcus sp. BA-124 BA4]CAK6686921.1 2-methoxy-6-polyprenyl-1,4-benzoquinol methylase, mitochondrial [Synechococcus sp. CBW1107]